MKQLVVFFLMGSFFVSCRTAKISNEKADEKKKEKDSYEDKKMIRSGKYLNHNGQESEILFYGEDPSPKKVLFKNDSLVKIQKRDSL